MLKKPIAWKVVRVLLRLNLPGDGSTCSHFYLWILPLQLFIMFSVPRLAGQVLPAARRLLQVPFSLLVNHLPVCAFSLSQQTEWTHPKWPCLGVNFAAEVPELLSHQNPWTVLAPYPKWILDEGNHTFCQGKIILDEVMKWNDWNLTFICMHYDYPSFRLCAWTDRGRVMFIFKKVAQWRMKHRTTSRRWN